MFIPLTPVFSMDEESILLELPELEEFETFLIPDQKDLLVNLGNEIYKILYHFTEGNAVYNPEDSYTDDSKFYKKIKPVLRIVEIRVSEKGDVFCETELSIDFKRESDNKGADSAEDENADIDEEKNVDADLLLLAYTGVGDNEYESFMNAVSRLPELFKYRYSEFEKKSGFFRILDFYRKEVIVSCGSDDGFSKGDYLEIINSINSEPHGRIILTDTDRDVGYGRILEWDKKKSGITDASGSAESSNIENPEEMRNKHLSAVGYMVRKINYIGLDTSFSASYLFDDLYKGNAQSIRLEYFRSFYIFHPLVSAGFFSLEGADETFNLTTFSAGIAMIRHFGKMSLRSEASAVKGNNRDSNSSWDYTGGAVKGGIDYSLTKHTGIFADAGFIRLFSQDKGSPDVGGFLFGGGLSFKY